MAVNKFRGSKNQEIVDLVKKMIKGWKDEVKKAKTKPEPKKPSAAVALVKYSDNRSFKTDGVETQIYDNKTRNGSLQALYNGLAKDNKTVSSEEIFGIVKNIEIAVLDLAKGETGDVYRSKLRSLVMNIKSSNNPELRHKILAKDVTPSKLVVMTPEEMVFNEKLKTEREQIEKENLFKAKSAVEKRAITDSFQCGKCKQRKVTYYQMQTRSADEPLTTFCSCVNCGNHWTFS